MQQIGHSEESVELASSAAKFVRTRQAYYGREFEKIQAATRLSLVMELDGCSRRAFLGRVPRYVGIFLDVPDS